MALLPHEKRSPQEVNVSREGWFIIYLCHLNNPLYAFYSFKIHLLWHFTTLLKIFRKKRKIPRRFFVPSGGGALWSFAQISSLASRYGVFVFFFTPLCQSFVFSKRNIFPWWWHAFVSSRRSLFLRFLWLEKQHWTAVAFAFLPSSASCQRGLLKTRNR